MRKRLISLCLIIFCAVTIQAQDHKAELLHEPASWEFERFELPPSFAPGIVYKGAEELRFAPGMFKKDSANYFTYVFVAQLNDVTGVSQADIKDYLLKYYKGLCSSVATDSKLTIDTSKITATVEKRKGIPASQTIYNAVLDIFGVFADGAPVKLNMEVKVLVNAATKKTYLFFLASPKKKEDPSWVELYAIREKFVMPK